MHDLFNVMFMIRLLNGTLKKQVRILGKILNFSLRLTFFPNTPLLLKVNRHN